MSRSQTGPFTFVAEWSGPFTYADPTDLDAGGNPKIKPLPADNYPFVLKATRGTAPNQQEIASAAYDKLALVEVKSIELVQCSSMPGVTCPDAGAVVTNNVRASTGGTMPGGGKAASPDASAPGGDYRRSVVVKAELEPNLGADAGQVKVFFQWVDVDDPSAGGLDAQGQPVNDPIDNDTVATPDNRNESALPIAAAMASPATGGAAAGVFQVSTQQGNNYRLAATTLDSWLTGIQSVTISQAGEVTHTSGEPLLDSQLVKGPQVSEMLTVWRTLHLELKPLSPSLTGAAQQQIQRNGFWTRIGRTWRSFPPFAAGRVLEDTAASFILIREGKGKKDRMVPLGKKAKEVLVDYLENARPKLVRGTTSTVFLGKLGQPLSINYVSDRVKTLGARIGLKVQPHMLRHYSASLIMPSEVGCHLRSDRLAVQSGDGAGQSLGIVRVPYRPFRKPSN